MQLKDFILNQYQWDSKLRFLLESFSLETIVLKLIEYLENPAFFQENTFEINTFARDIYIGSDLLPDEKTLYIETLYKHQFFSLLSQYLKIDNFNNRNAIVYNIGKFSLSQNAIYLETFYTSNTINCPILASKTLFELNWLDSKKTNQFISTLQLQNTLTDQLTLFYYYDTIGESQKAETILMNPTSQKFINPHNLPLTYKDITNRLQKLEIAFSNAQTPNKNFELLLKLRQQFFVYP